METCEFTPKVQKIILYMDSKGPVCFDTQDIFKSKKFYDAMRFLKRNGIVNPVCNVCFKKLQDNHKIKCDSNNLEHKKSQKKEKYFKLTVFAGGFWALALGSLV